MSDTEDRPLLSRNDPEQIARFRQAVKAQKERQAAPKDAGAAVFYTPNDQHYKGYCPSLDLTFEGRSHWKQVQKEKEIHCVG